MAKQLNYVLNFNADTAKARQEMQGLQKQLEELTRVASKPAGGSGLTAEFQEAAKAAAMLKAQVEGAMNTRTGTLDLGMLNQSFKQAGVSLQSYQSKLTKLGPEGVRTFQAIAQSILSAEVPLRRSNGMLTEFATTLKNTARWQISSSILHGFMGTLQSAYGYAKDLNESLNNIRIVTGYSTDQMASFAAEANKAAQALNTTTTNYTDATLIYYQQGLSDDVVKARTDTTIKFANVARESANVASQELTAIWNNFADGADNLDYYADVLVKLGATTASSSQEISAGLQKFAAISDAIGLSYEYAAAALATVTATTRQSADIVGTAFKTLFSRLEGLQLGETLEDGTDLNKYSAALSAVGIQIKDTNGDLKDMDVILDELGGRWDTLSRDQQMALAQTVAGVRQYTQLVALMDNWDFFQENVATARGAGGALDEQAEIYAESWEAARKRVKAAAEEIYNALLDDDFFIGLNDGLAKFLGMISNVIEGMGGLKGVLAGIGVLITNAFGDKMAASIDNFFLRLQGKEAVAMKMRQEALTALQTSSGTEMGKAYASLVEPQQALIRNAKSLNETEIAIAQAIIEQQKYRVQAVQQAEKAHQIANDELTSEVQKAQILSSRVGGAQSTIQSRNTISTIVEQARAAIPEVVKLETASEQAYQSFEKMVNSTSYTDITSHAQQMRAAFQDIDISKLPTEVQQLIETIRSGTASTEQLQEAFELLNQISLSGIGNMFRAEIEQALIEAGLSGEQLETALNGVVGALDKTAAAAAQEAARMREAAEGGRMAAQTIDELKAKASSAGQVIVKLGQAFSSFAMILSSIQGIKRVINDEDLSAGEKFATILMNLGMLLPAVVNGINALVTAIPMLMSGMKTLVAGFPIIIATIGELIAIFAPFLAIAGVLIVVAGALSQVNAELDRANKAAEQAAETSKNLANAANEAASKLSAIQTAIDGYDSAVEKLNACTRGTQEWDEALVGVKQQIDELITKFPELLKEKDLFDEDGLLNEEVLDKALQRAKATSQAANLANYQGQIEAQRAQLNADLVRAEKRYGAGGANPTHESGVRADVNAVAAAVQQLNASTVTLVDVQRVLGNVSKDYAQDIRNLAQSAIDASTMVENANDRMVKEWAEINEKTLTTGQAKLMAQRQQKYFDTYSQEFERANRANKKTDRKDTSELSGYFGRSRFSGMSITEAFNAARGTDYALARNGVRGTDENRTYAFMEDGEIKEYRLEEMQATVAAAAALEQMEASAQLASAALESIDEHTPEEIGKGLENYLSSGNFESMSRKDFESMQSDLGSYGGNINKYLKSLTGLDNRELIELLGPNYVGEFQTAMRNYETAIEDITADLSSSITNAYDELKSKQPDVADMGVSAQKSIIEALTQAEERYGSSGLEQMTNILGEIDSSSLEGFSDILDSMDWSTQGPREFIVALKEAGVETGLTTQQLKFLASALSTAPPRALSDAIKELREELKELDIGSIIDDEVFQDLQDKLGSDVLDNFINTLDDGTHIITDDVNKINDALFAVDVEPYLDKMQRIFDVQNQHKRDTGQSFIEDLISSQRNAEEAERSGTEEQAKWTSFAYEKLSEVVAANSAVLQANANDAALCASNMEQLQGVLESIAEIDALDGAADIDYMEAFGQGLMNLATQYNNCTQELRAYNAALASGNEEQKTAAENNLEIAVRSGEAAAAFDLEADAIEDIAHHYQELGASGDETYAALANNAELASDAAVRYLRLNRGLEDLQDSYEDVCEVIDDLSKGLGDEVRAADKSSQSFKTLKKGLADMLDTTEDVIDMFGDDWIGDNADDIKKAINGDIDAIRRLQKAAGDEIQLQFNSDEANAAFDELQSKMDGLADGADLLAPGVDLGPYIQDLVWAMQLAGDAQADIENKLSAMGIDVDLAPMQQSLNDAIAMAGQAGAMTSDAYASSAGVDAAVNSQTDTAVDRQENVNVQEFVYGSTMPISGTVMESEGSEPKPVTINVPYFTKHVRSAVVPETATKETTAQALEVKGATKSSGGKVSSKNKGGGGGGGGGGRKGCFVAGTPITTKRGFLPIEQIRVGDIVLSYNERTQLNEYSQVLETMIHIVVEPIYTLVVEDEILQVTGNHRLYIERNNQYLWLPVEELTLSDKIRYASGKFQTIDGIFTEVRATVVYNFEVSNNHNYYVGRSRILAHNKGGGGGGGGGQAKPHQAAAVGQKLERPTRYQRVDQALTNSKRNMDRLSETTDRAFGTKKLEKFEKQIELLNKDTEILNDKLKEIGDTTSGYLSKDLADLKTQFKDLNIPIQIDSEGFVTNFEDLSYAAVDAYNQVALAYDAWDKAQVGVDENSDAYKNAKEQWDRDLEVAKDLYDKRIEAIKQWQDTWNLKQDTIDEIADNARAAFDKALEGVTYKMDVRLKVKDAKDQIREFEKTLAESFGDAITHGLKTAAIDYQQVSAEMGMVQYFREESEELQKLLSEATDASSIEDIKDAMLDLQGNILDSAEAMLDWIDMVENMVPDAVEAARDRFDQFLDQLDHNSTILDTIKELMALQGQTYRTQAGFANLQKVAQEQMKTALADAVLNRKWFEEAEQRLAQAQADLEGVAEDDVRYDYLKNRRDAYLEEFNASQEAYLESAQEAMEIAKDMYLEQIQQAIYEFGKAVSGDALDFAAQKFDHFIDTEGRYLDTVNKAYQQQMWATKIQADYDKDILGTHRDLIKAFEQEYNALFNRTRVNEYDLKILEARYKVMEATMALQDAENAKNNLRLVRDRQGNWNYQFTADQGAVAEAEQQQAEAQNEWYNIAKEQTEQVTSDIVQLWQDSADAIQEIFEDEELTEEEKWERIAEIEEYYTQKAADLYGDRTQAYNDLVEAGKLSIDDFKTTYADTLVEMTGNANDYETALNDTINNCKDHFNEYQANIKQVASESHTDLDNLKKDVDKVSESTEKLKTKGQETANALWDTVDKINGTADSYANLFEQVQSVINAMRELAGVQAGTVAALSGMGGEITDYAAYAKWAYDTGGEEGLDLYLADRESTDRYDDVVSKGGLNTQQLKQAVLSGEWENSASSEQRALIEQIWTPLLEITKKKVSSGATGMYTGEWGSSGKLAFLHEKELVLNKEDTENILAAVGIIRSIESALDSRALTMQGQMISMLSGYTPTIPQATSDKTVTNYFDVAFPNATSSSEIEEALRNLANNADQWAERRDR